MIEKEYKVLINAKEYNRVLNLFDFEEEYVQINLYYVGRDEREQATVRVRCKFNKIYLQVKIDVSKEKGIHIKREYEKEIFIIPYMISKDDLNSLCNVDYFEDRFLADTLITVRKNYIYKGNIVSLDRNVYLGITDYELEIEYQDELDNEIIEKLKRENIYNEKNSKGKFERFMEKYEKK